MKFVAGIASFFCLEACALAVDPAEVFENPSAEAHAGVWWHWMGCNVSTNGIARDLKYFKETGVGLATIFGMADVCTPWATSISNSPTAGLIAFTPRWWSFVRYAAEEGKKLGIDIGLHNCPGYTSTGGPWIPPELGMRELCFSSVSVHGTGAAQTVPMQKPQVNPRAHAAFPVMNDSNGKLETPVIEARRTDVRDIAVLAFPVGKQVKKEEVRDLTASFCAADNTLSCTLPPGAWTLLRVCHVPMGSFTQPNQWEAFGLECDKMSEKAVNFHLDHVLGGLKAHLGPLVGTGLRHILLDSYEAGTPNWTPLMREAFSSRRGYDLTPFLPTFCNVVVGGDAETQRFKRDFSRTISDLYRDVLFKIMGERLRRENLVFFCEPYTGPFDSRECAAHVECLMTEFWAGRSPCRAAPAPLGWDSFPRPDGKPHNIIAAEAFTGQPDSSRWDETPWVLKSIGDVQFCRGVNRFILHTCPLQPWSENVRPGEVMGRWGTHFGSTQTWAKPGKAWFSYLARCQALLQWGAPFTAPRFEETAKGTVFSGRGRKDGNAAVFFIANLSSRSGACRAVCDVAGQQPEWFDPVTGREVPLTVFETVGNSRTAVPLVLAPRQSGFLVFRKPVDKAITSPAAARLQTGGDAWEAVEISGPWSVRFDPAWGGPEKEVVFNSLTDWTKNADFRVRYYSGTAVYRTAFDFVGTTSESCRIQLGDINGQMTSVRVNGHECGTVWCAPWEAEIPAGLLKKRGNVLEMEHSNVWANRLIGDEQEPADCEWKNAPMPGGKYLAAFPDWFVRGEKRPSSKRFCFTTWNYFTKDSPLVSSGVIGPVRLVFSAR